MDIEQRLRASLNAREPEPDFEARVMARLSVVGGATVPSRRRFTWRIPVSLAATTCAVAFALHFHGVQQREARAGQQLALALEITSAQLNLVQQRLGRIETIDAKIQENGS